MCNTVSNCFGDTKVSMWALKTLDLSGNVSDEFESKFSH